jgi:hypothetical protein
MRFTRSQARAQAAEEAQTSLLQIATAQITQTHTSLIENLEIPTPLPTILEDVPLELVIPGCPSILPISVLTSTMVASPTPAFIRKKTRLPLTSGVKGLPVPKLKQRQEQYRVALRIQCVTLLDARIPIDIICTRWLVTKSAVYQWKRIAKARGYDPEVDPCLLCSHVENAPYYRRPSLQTYERTREMIKQICANKEGRNLNCQRLRGRIGVSSATAFRMLKKNRFQSVKESTKPGLTEEMKKARLEFCKAHEY